MAHANPVAAVVWSACAFSAIPYTARPDRIENPGEEAMRIIKATVNQGCIAEPALDRDLFTVKWVCQGGVGSESIRFDRVQRISMERYSDWYRVVVHHSVGEDFTWAAQSQEDIERLADALTALSKPVAPAAAKPAQSI